MCNVCGEGAVTEQTCQKLFAVLHAANFSLKDSPKSARPVKVYNDKPTHYLRTINVMPYRR